MDMHILPMKKVISDFEVVRYVLRYLREFDINEDTIPLDLIDEVGHDGEYLTKDHTFQYCHTEPLAPTLCSPRECSRCSSSI